MIITVIRQNTCILILLLMLLRIVTIHLLNTCKSVLEVKECNQKPFLTSMQYSTLYTARIHFTVLFVVRIQIATKFVARLQLGDTDSLFRLSIFGLHCSSSQAQKYHYGSKSQATLEDVNVNSIRD